MAGLFFALPVLGQETTAKRPGKVVVGPVDVTAGLVFTEEFNDNIFANRTNRVPDFISILSPALDITYRANNARISAGGLAEFAFHANNTDENYQDYRVYLDSFFRLSPLALISAGASHERQHEDRSSPDDVFGIRPTIFRETSGYAATRYSFGDFALNLGATADVIDFDDVNTRVGNLNNDDRDRTVATAGAKLNYRANDDTSWFTNFTYDFRDYSSRVDDNGFMRDSQGVRVSTGFAHKLTENLEGEAYAGLIYQTYDDAAFDEISRPDFGGQITWRPMPGTRIIGSLDRNVRETTLAGSPGYIQTVKALSFRQWLRPDIRFNAGAAYYDNRYQNIGRSDHIATYTAGLRKYLTPFVYVGPSIAFTSRDSSTIGENYKETSVMFRIGRTRDAAYGAGALEQPDIPPSRFAGFYVGAQGGLPSVGTKLTGARGNGGALGADFGDDVGVLGGIFAGTGVNVGPWYFGAEGEATFADSGWDHGRLPGGRVFSVDRKESFGLAAVAGKHLPGGNMVFTRGGFNVTKFDTAYQTARNRTTRSGRELGLTVGVGGAAALSPQLSLRMDYNYTSYNDFEIGPRNQPDVFANDESGARIGLAYQFYENNAAPAPIKDHDFEGLYGGVQAGHGTLTSNTMGERNAGSVLVADFGDTGFTGGLFGGYGGQFGNFFIGGEITAEISDADWDLERVPTGRAFSVEKVASLGAGVLAGYVVNNAALLYGRADIVQTIFDIDFNNGNRSIKDTESVAGLRLGLGMELPVTELASLRFDYSHTTYQDFNLMVGSGGGVEDYETNESLFRVGAIIRR